MKKREMSNQLEWIAEVIHYWVFKTQKGIYVTDKNLYRVRDLAQKKIAELYLHINRVKNQLDGDLNDDKKNKRFHREMVKEIKAYDKVYGKDSWYDDYEDRKPIPSN